MQGYITQEDAPPIYWDVGMDLITYPEHATAQRPTAEEIENGMRFWATVANEGINTETTLNANATGFPNLRLVAGDASHDVERTVPNPMPRETIRLDNSEGSSIGSTKEHNEATVQKGKGVLASGSANDTQPSKNGMSV